MANVRSQSLFCFAQEFLNFSLEKKTRCVFKLSCIFLSKGDRCKAASINHLGINIYLKNNEYIKPAKKISFYFSLMYATVEKRIKFWY